MARNHSPHTAIWTPDGDITTHQNIDRATADEMRLLMNLHKVAQKFGFSVNCTRCGGAIVGMNASPNSKLMSVSCGCREIRAEMHQGVLI